MSAAPAILAALQLARFANDLVIQWQRGEMTEEEVAIELDKVAAEVTLANKRWEAAGLSLPDS